MGGVTGSEDTHYGVFVPPNLGTRRTDSDIVERSCPTRLSLFSAATFTMSNIAALHGPVCRISSMMTNPATKSTTAKIQRASGGIAKEMSPSVPSRNTSQKEENPARATMRLPALAG